MQEHFDREMALVDAEVERYACTGNGPFGRVRLPGVRSVFCPVVQKYFPGCIDGNNEQHVRGIEASSFARPT